jgi:cytidylate kinase
LTSFQNKRPVIAIDGTASSGKGTLAKKLSKSTGFDHLDSGLLYRVYAYEFLKRSKDLSKVENVTIDFSMFNSLDKLTIKNLRSEEVSKAASLIAKNTHVRKSLINIQRKIADHPKGGKGSVIDGRDITSVIIPKAEIKFYVDANIKVRAKRRQDQLKMPNENFQEILVEMKKRDENDKKRKNSPLVKTKDSFFIDTSHISEDEVFKIALREVKKKIDFI